MLQRLALLAFSFALCQAQIVTLRLQEPQELPGLRQRVFITDGRQQLASGMHSPLNDLSASSQPLFGMARSADGDWDSWMDSQFSALDAMNKALLGQHSGCGGRMRMQQSFAPVLIRGVPTMTTPAVVLQRLASARFGNQLLQALIEDQMRSESQDRMLDSAAFDDSFDDLPQAQIADVVMNSIPAATVDGNPMSSQVNTETLTAMVGEYVDNEDSLAWDQNERMLSQEDVDEEADAEADAVEADAGEWSSLLPSWITDPQDQELLHPSVTSTGSINWSLMNDDGSTNWGLVIFIIQAAACVTVWVGLVATLGYYSFGCRAARSSRGRPQFATAADSHLMTPLMYEPASKDGPAAIYDDLYTVEDAKLHADDKHYVTIQYEPLKTEQ